VVMLWWCTESSNVPLNCYRKGDLGSRGRIREVTEQTSLSWRILRESLLAAMLCRRRIKMSPESSGRDQLERYELVGGGGARFGEEAYCVLEPAEAEKLRLDFARLGKELDRRGGDATELPQHRLDRITVAAHRASRC
jgi:hypothetical protein